MVACGLALFHAEPQAAVFFAFAMEKLCPACGQSVSLSAHRCSCGLPFPPNFANRPSPTLANIFGAVFGAIFALFVVMAARSFQSLDALCVTPLVGGFVGSTCGTVWWWIRHRKNRPWRNDFDDDHVRPSHAEPPESAHAPPPETHISAYSIPRSDNLHQRGDQT